MLRGRGFSAIAILCALALSGCAGEALETGDGWGMCSLASARHDALFGMPVTNVTGDTVTVQQVGFDHLDGVHVDGAWLVPSVQVGEDLIGAGIAEYPPADAELPGWTSRVDAVGASIAPGEETFLVVHLFLDDSAKSGVARGARIATVGGLFVPPSTSDLYIGFGLEPITDDAGSEIPDPADLCVAGI